MAENEGIAQVSHGASKQIAKARAEGYAKGCADTLADIDQWLQEKLGDWDKLREHTNSRTGFLLGIISALHGSKRDIRRGASLGARLRARVHGNA